MYDSVPKCRWLELPYPRQVGKPSSTPIKPIMHIVPVPTLLLRRARRATVSRLARLHVYAALWEDQRC